MAGGFVDSLVIGIGLDTSQIAEGVQKVGAQLDSGLSAAAQSAASKMSPLGEALKGLADKAGEIGKPAEASLQAMHQLGLKAASEYQEQIDAIKAGLAQIRNDPALSVSDKASATDAAMAQMDALKAKMEGLKEPADAALEAIHSLGLRTADEIHQALEKAKADYEAIRASATLTDRDKAAGLAQTKTKIEQLEMELKRGLPQAAAQGFAGAEAAANKFRGVIGSIWAQVSGPLMGAFAIGGTISSYISNSMSAGELADKLKVDVEEIQIWSGAMDRAGGSAASLQATIEKLNASGKAHGDAIGVLLDLADKAGTMSKEAFVQKAKELEIDEKTIEVLAQGRKALDEHLKRQRELGAYTKEDAEQSKKFKQSLADLLQAWDGFTSFIGRFTVPIMRVLADALTAVVVFLRQHTAFVVAAISLVGAVLTARLIPPLRTLPALIANVGKAFLRWLPFVAVITALALLIEDFWVYLQGGESELAEFWSIFGTGPEILEKLNSAWKETKTVLASIGTGLAQLVRYWYDLMKASGMFAALGQTFKGLLQILKGIFTLDWSLLGEGLSNVLNGMVRGVAATFKGLGILVRDLVKALWNALRDLVPGFAQLTDGLSDIFNGIFDFDLGKIAGGLGKWLSGIGTMLVSGIKGMLNLSANAWSAIIEVFTGQKIDLAGWVNEAWDKAAAKFAEIKNWVLGWISSLFGDGEAPDFGAIAEKIWNSIKETFGKIKEWVVNWVKSLFTGIEMPKIGDILGGAGDLAKGALGGAASLLGKGFDLAKAGAGKAGDLIGGLLGSASEGAAKVGEKLTPMLQEGIDIAKKGLSAAGDFFSGLFRDAQPATAEAGAKVESGMAQTAGAVRDGFNAAWNATRNYAVVQFQGAASTIQQIFAGIVSGIETQVGNLVLGAQRMAGGVGMIPAAAGVRAQQAGGNRSSTFNQSNRINVYAPGGDPAKVQRGVERGLNQNGRTVRAAASGTVQK